MGLSGTAFGLIPAYHFSRSIQKFIMHLVGAIEIIDCRWDKFCDQAADF
jgi:hypothetical protein